MTSTAGCLALALTTLSLQELDSVLKPPSLFWELVTPPSADLWQDLDLLTLALSPWLVNMLLNLWQLNLWEPLDTVPPSLSTVMLWMNNADSKKNNTESIRTNTERLRPS